MNSERYSTEPQSGTDTEGNNCFSICQNIEMKQEINFYITLKYRELLKNETNEHVPSRSSTPRWIVQDSRRLMNQSERA